MRTDTPLLSQNTDREFVLKVAALEIYNEVVKDLLASDSAPLRLLDDKEVSRRYVVSTYLRFYSVLRPFSALRSICLLSPVQCICV